MPPKQVAHDSVVETEYKTWVPADGHPTLWMVKTYRSGWTDWHFGLNSESCPKGGSQTLL